MCSFCSSDSLRPFWFCADLSGLTKANQSVCLWTWRKWNKRKTPSSVPTSPQSCGPWNNCSSFTISVSPLASLQPISKFRACLVPNGRLFTAAKRPLLCLPCLQCSPSWLTPSLLGISTQTSPPQWGLLSPSLQQPSPTPVGRFSLLPLLSSCLLLHFYLMLWHDVQFFLILTQFETNARHFCLLM